MSCNSVSALPTEDSGHYFTPTAGETPPLKLDNPKNNFERGDVDLFVVKAHEVGEPQKLKVCGCVGEGGKAQGKDRGWKAERGLVMWSRCMQWGGHRS